MAVDYSKIIENDFEEPIYISKYNELINYLTTYGPTEFWKIIREVGGSERRMMRLIEEMINEGTIEFVDNKFNLKNNVSKYNYNMKEVEQKMKDIWNRKPIPTLFFDQRPVTLETTINRVKYLLQKNDVYDKKIVMLGDDDLTSVALALTGVNCTVVALDVDERLIDFINQVAKEYNLNLKAYVFNALDEVSDDFSNKFDVLMTDPTPERIPFTLFMNDAIKLVKKENSIIYTSIYSSAMAKTLDLQKVITSMNLYITDIIPFFTEYQAIYELYRDSDKEFMKKYNISFDSSSICFTESLFRMEVTGETKVLELEYKGKDIFGKATKRVINNREDDVVKNQSSYLDEVESMIKSSADKDYISK